MGPVPRGTASLVALFVCSFVTACGGSLTDQDRPQSSRASEPPASPFCVAAQASSEAIRPLNASGGGRAENLPDTVDAVRRAGSELVATAPPEVRADAERTVPAVNLQLDVLMANGGDTSALARNPELVARLSSPEFAGASEHYRAYVTRNCTAGSGGDGTR